MPSRRLFLAALLTASVVMVEAAAAQGNGNGNGNGGGNANGAGNGNGSGNSSGNGNGGGNGKGKGNAGGAPATGAATPAAAVARTGTLPSLRLRHSNGFVEEVEGGRYEMRDNRGRQIVNRVARNSDYARLSRLSQ